MDYLDPKKRRAHTVKLFTGYVLIAIAIGLATIVLLYQAYGFGLHKGKVIQNGLIFVSSTPGGSKINLNGQNKGTTGARLVLEAGNYTLQIQRNGYRTWQRAVTIEGGTVEHFDYPFLFPDDLVTTTTHTYTSSPPLATQSPDRRRLLIEQSGALTNFDFYDLKNPKQVVRTGVSLPANVLTPATGAQSLKLVAWSNDNRHVLLKHIYDSKKYEYILLDTQTPSDSLNLTKTLNSASAEITLANNKYNQYFIYNAAAKTLGTASLGNTAAASLVRNVLDYKTYGTNIVLYATAQNAPAGEARVMLYQNSRSYFIRDVALGKTYLLNLAQYSGSWYVAAGSGDEDRVYVYQDPVAQLQAQPNAPLVPVDALKVKHANYVEFSANTQFVVAENANQFGVYDVQYDKDYTYTVPVHLDAPQLHATWMDGDRLDYVSGGKLVVFDYDSTNFQTLMSASPNYQPFFNQGYNFVYALAPQAATAKAPASMQLTSTPLLTPADQ